MTKNFRLIFIIIGWLFGKFMFKNTINIDFFGFKYTTC